MNNFDGLDKDSAKLIISKCSASTQALSEIVDILRMTISEEENRIFRNNVYDIFMKINECVIEPIHNLYPDLKA